MAEDTIPVIQEFEHLAQTEPLPGVGRLMIGYDHRVYRKATGMVELICEAEPAEDTKAGVWIGNVRWDDYPPMGYLATLFDNFLSKYDREVMFVVGKRYKPKDGNKWFCMVPYQEGTAGSISWKDKEGMDWFLERARFLGTVHIHPDSWCDPSSVDIEHWSEKPCSGLHVIFGRDGSFTVHGSIAGHVVRLGDGDVKDTKRIEAPLFTSRNRKLKKLLKKPKQRFLLPGDNIEWKKVIERYQRTGGDIRIDDPIRSRLFMASRAVMWDSHTIDRMWLVSYGQRGYLLTEGDYKSYRREAVMQDWYDAPEGVAFVPEGAGMVDYES
jgi:proteasome lid subunit RPN8/RPN11